MVQALNDRRSRLLVHYRHRAEELRSIADNYSQSARKTLLDIAAMYDKLAEDECTGSQLGRLVNVTA